MKTKYNSNTVITQDVITKISESSNDDYRIVIKGVSFSEMDFTSLNFNNIYFLNCTFEKSIFCDTVFEKCEFVNCRFTNFDMIGKTGLEYCSLESCQFDELNIDLLDFAYCHIKNLQMSDIRKNRIIFVHCYMNSIYLDLSSIRSFELLSCMIDYFDISKSTMRLYITSCKSERMKLINSNLFGSIISNSHMTNFNIDNCVLRSSKLQDSCFSNGYFKNSPITNCNLDYSSFNSCEMDNSFDMSNVSSFVEAQGVTNICPEKGSFIGFKKVLHGRIVELLIPEDAIRSSGTNRKCRCDKAVVLSITEIDGSAASVSRECSIRDETFVYEVGKVVTSECDRNRWKVCSQGIHFFITREEAVQYVP